MSLHAEAGGEVTESSVGIAIGLGGAGDAVAGVRDAGLVHAGLPTRTVGALGAANALATCGLTDQACITLRVPGAPLVTAAGSVALADLSGGAVVIEQALNAGALGEVAELANRAIVMSLTVVGISRRGSFYAAPSYTRGGGGAVKIGGAAALGLAGFTVLPATGIGAGGEVAVSASTAH